MLPFNGVRWMGRNFSVLWVYTNAWPYLARNGPCGAILTKISVARPPDVLRRSSTFPPIFYLGKKLGQMQFPRIGPKRMKLKAYNFDESIAIPSIFVKLRIDVHEISICVIVSVQWVYRDSKSVYWFFIGQLVSEISTSHARRRSNDANFVSYGRICDFF